mmetsp:Transcript_15406/g.29633  ORF Transcript_15406/g.29633 Transcript_15406/m.29633 type:complete len:235 (+) Transcript_15406:632-1336(+)
MRCVATSSALRICSKCSWCARIAASSSSSITSIRPCSRVLPTSTSRMGSTSKSKSNRSPASICVSASIPIFMGMNSGVGGRSMKGSVWVFTSRSGTVSVSSSRNESVCTSICLRPSTAPGAAPPAPWYRCPCPPPPALWRFVEPPRFSFGGAAGRICAAYVLPRITRRSYMMLEDTRPISVSSSTSRYFGFFRLATGRGSVANVYESPPSFPCCAFTIVETQLDHLGCKAAMAP